MAESKYIDYFSINSDYIGFRDVHDTHELVSFNNNSTLRIWYNIESSSYDPHWHTALEIIVPLENYYEAEINSIIYHVEPGNIMIIPPGELHKLNAPPSGSRFIFLFDLSVITRLKGFSGVKSVLTHPLYISKDSSPEVHRDLYELLIAMTNEYFSRSEFMELSIYALLIQFFVKLGYHHLNQSELFSNVKLDKRKEYIQKFNNLINYIDTHYMEDLDLEEIAESIGFSKFHFSRLFKQYTNFTFCGYLCYRRIKAAEELLAIPDLSITEISLQIGFSSISTFNRVFKQQKNCTPSEYRAKNQPYNSIQTIPPMHTKEAD